jgi:hypothetical protein
MVRAITTPVPNRAQAMMAAWGEASTTRVSPGAASPNWKTLASTAMVRPTAIAEAITPKNFTRSWAAGVEPSQ